MRRSGWPAASRRSGWWASYRLDVPRAQALKLQADNGGLHLSQLSGDVELNTVNGGLHLDEVGGHIHGATVNGGIHMELSGSEWEGEGAFLQTTNGGVHLELPSDYNARLEASTVNGGVQSDVRSTQRGRQRGGRVAVELGRGGPLLRLETTNGGLHIAQRFIEHMRGRIGFDSTPGHGATFWIELPAVHSHAGTVGW